MLMSKIRKKMHIGIWIIAILFIGGIFLVFGVGSGLNPQQKQNDKKSKNILTIGKEKIPRELYEYEHTQVLNSIPYKVDNYQMRMLVASQTVRRMLQQEVLIREAEKRKLKVTSGELKSRIKSDRDRMLGPVDAAKNPGIVDRAKIWLAENQKNKEYREMMASSGVPYKTYKEAVRRGLLAEKARNAIAQELVTAEAKKVEQKARDAWRKLDKGEVFGSIANQYSEDQATADNEGLMGWKTRADLDKPVADMAFGLQPGAYSEPIRSNLGFEIIMVDAVKTASGAEYEKFRQSKLQEIQAQGADAKMPTEREMQRLYESVLLKHILFSIKDNQVLVGEWAEKRVKDKSFKYKILDPEIKAFMALQDSMDQDKGTFTIKGLDKALAEYESALIQEKDNYNLYFQIGYIYEQKNDLLNTELEEKNQDKDKKKDDEKFQDPFDEDDGEDKKTPKSIKFLDSAMESYKKAYDMMREEGNDDPDIILGLARVTKLLAENSKKDAARHTKQARKYYTEAFDFSLDLSPATLYRLREIRTALMDLKGDKETIKELDAAIADIEMEQGISQPQMDTQQFKVGEEGEGGPQTVTITNEDGTTTEIPIEDLLQQNKDAAGDVTPPASGNGQGSAAPPAGEQRTPPAMPESVPAETAPVGAGQ